MSVEHCVESCAEAQCPCNMARVALHERFSVGCLALATVDLVLLYSFRTMFNPAFWAISSPLPGVHPEDFILNSYSKRSKR
jgi:hypothetical protein